MGSPKQLTTIMLLSKFLKSFLAVACLCSLSACSNDEPNGNSSSIGQDDNLSVTIKADGSTSNGASFSQLDGKTFFLDHVKYEIVGTHLEIIDCDFDELPSTPKLYAEVTIGNTVYKTRAIDGFHYSNISSIVLPKTITRIRGHAFDGCSSLTYIKLPESLTSIESYVFYGCTSLKEITLPKNLEDIGAYTFWDCKSLKKVTFLSLTPPKESVSDLFELYPTAPTAYVKSEALGAYRYWDRHNYFAEIKPIYY